MIENHERASLNVRKVEAARRMCTAAREGSGPNQNQTTEDDSEYPPPPGLLVHSQSFVPVGSDPDHHSRGAYRVCRNAIGRSSPPPLQWAARQLATTKSRYHHSKSICINGICDRPLQSRCSGLMITLVPPKHHSKKKKISIHHLFSPVVFFLFLPLYENRY